MNCKDMKAIIKNVENGDSENKFVVAKAFGGDNMLWYYGRYATAEKAFIVAKEITNDECVGIVVIDEYYDIFAKMNEIEEYIKMTDDVIENGAKDYPDDTIREFAAKKTGFEYIRKVVKGE